MADGSITSQGVADTKNTVNRGNILVGAYDGGGAQYIDTPKYGGTQRIEVAGYVAPNPNNDITKYNRHAVGGSYNWGGGKYDANDIIFDPTGNDTTINRRHGADGTYTWNIAGTDFLAKGGSLDYKANQDELEYVAWDNSFDPDNPPLVTPSIERPMRWKPLHFIPAQLAQCRIQSLSAIMIGQL